MQTIIVAVVTFILGYIAGIYLPLKFRKEDRTPKVSISPFQERHNYFDITNHGGDILNFSVLIQWFQDGEKQEKVLNDFFDMDEDPVLKYPHKCNSLKKGETKKVAHCPLYSDDGKVKIAISGEDINGKRYSEKSILENKIKS